ncbi:MAG: hypothetical protein HYV27_08695 [Candidatus Hydrogenedentes bacterium]|nr:hypothetical protein [Candidatus Hydrogenedentota bacterium]
MSNLKYSLEIKRAQLMEQHAQNVESLNQIQELLRKADLRRVQEADNPRKWDKILDNLEESLTQAKVRVEVSSLDLKRIEREIGTLAQTQPPAQEADDGNPPSFAAQDAQDLVEAGAMPSDAQDKERARRTHFVLRSALEKIQLNRIDDMTPPEIQITHACYKNLSNMKNLSPKNERLKRIITAAVKILNRRAQERPA